MIIHNLIRHHLKHGDDDAFYIMQAQDAIRWIEACGVSISPNLSVLDLGCGSGIFGAEFVKRGCKVEFSDRHPSLRPNLQHLPFREFTVGQDDLGILGQFDLILFSNVYEHLAKPDQFLLEMHKALKPGGVIFLSWTNWLSPWGGHDFSPFHYLGPRTGHRVYDFFRPGKRQHIPFVGLFPTYIGETLRKISKLPEMRVSHVAPRYYTEFAWLMRIPVLREFLAWNCAMLIQRKP